MMYQKTVTGRDSDPFVRSALGSLVVFHISGREMSFKIKRIAPTVWSKRYNRFVVVSHYTFCMYQLFFKLPGHTKVNIISSLVSNMKEVK